MNGMHGMNGIGSGDSVHPMHSFQRFDGVTSFGLAQGPRRTVARQEHGNTKATKGHEGHEGRPEQSFVSFVAFVLHAREWLQAQ